MLGHDAVVKSGYVKDFEIGSSENLQSQGQFSARSSGFEIKSVRVDMTTTRSGL